MPSSLTPIKVSVKIGGNTITNQDVGFHAISVSIFENTIAEGELTLSFKKSQALDSVRELFPSTSNQGIKAQEVEVKFTGTSTPASFLKEDFTIFKGFIVGFGDQKSVGNVYLTLNLRGALYSYQNLPIMSPGFHVSSPYAFTVQSNQISAQTNIDNNVRQILLSTARRKDNALEIFKAIVDAYETAITTGVLVPSGSRKIFPAFKDALAQSANAQGKTFISQGIDSIKAVGDISFAPSGVQSEAKQTAIYNAVWGILTGFTSNPSLTFWELLLAIFSKFGINMVPWGDRIIVFPKSPLDEPVKYNIIKPTDYSGIVSQDFPFFAPTRAIVNTRYNQGLDPRTQSEAFGEYPDSATPTAQELATGVFAKFFEAPGFLHAFSLDQKQRAAAGQPSLFDFSKQGRKAVANAKTQQNQSATTIQDFQTLLNAYAKYLLYEDRFKQRTGQLECQYLPYVLPGLPGRVTDPLDATTFDMKVVGVNHFISSQSVTAKTTIVFNHIHRDSEIQGSGGSQANPFYSGFNVTGAADEYAKEVGVDSLI